MDAADDEPDKDVQGAAEGDHTMQAVVGQLSYQGYMLLLLLLLLLHHNYIACNGRWKEGGRDMQGFSEQQNLHKAYFLRGSGLTNHTALRSNLVVFKKLT